MGCYNEHNSGGARFIGENRPWWGRAGAHGSSRMTHVSGALHSVPNLLSLSPGLIDDGTAVFRVLGMLGHAHIAADE
jgi:hypothetical protein